MLLFVCFAIKIPMFPFHTWLPDALVEAPTPISVVLAAVLLKMGVYGILRVNIAILPEATRWAGGAIVAFGAVNVIYGALCAMAQDDLKRLVAYSSVSHMGFCLIGLGALTPQGIAACLFQMVSHGVVTAMLFLLVGVLYDRVHTRSIRAFGGLAGEMPLFASLAGLAFMASLGLPGLSGFWGEVLSLLGAFPSYRLLTTAAASGLVLSAAYHLGAFQRVFLGSFRAEWRMSAALDPFGGRFPEVTARELASIAPLAALTIVLGFWPVPLFALIAGGVRDVTSFVDPAGTDRDRKARSSTAASRAAGDAAVTHAARCNARREPLPARTRSPRSRSPIGAARDRSRGTCGSPGSSRARAGQGAIAIALSALGGLRAGQRRPGSSSTPRYLPRPSPRSRSSAGSSRVTGTPARSGSSSRS